MLKRRLPFLSAGLLVAAALIVGTSCNTQVSASLPLAPASKPDASTQRGFVAGTQVHKMPRIEKGESIALRPSSQSGVPLLSYYGGNIISNVSVVVVFWGTEVDPTVLTRIGPFYSSVTDSPYFDWLSEYNASGGDASTYQTVGRGSLLGVVTIAPINSSTRLEDVDIQTELDAQIAAGVLPAPDANTLYMTYFPPGVVISQGGSDSCSPGGFCAYHGTFVSSGGNVRYGVLPDMGRGSGCESTCGTDPISFNNLTTASSHELIEAVTDPDVGLATHLAPPLGWYDSVYGEIGDICNGQSDRVFGFSVQKEWSNQSGQCITSRGAIPPVSNVPDFSISLDSTSAAVLGGEQATFTLTTAALGQGNPDALALSLKGLPSSIQASFSTSSLNAGDGAILSLIVSPTAAPGTYNFTLTVTGTALSHSIHGSLIVNAPSVPTSISLTNGDFESGDFTGWQGSGTGSILSPGHRSTYAAVLGYDTPSQESYLFQAFDVPVQGATMSLWYQIHCPDTVEYDWATVLMRDNATGEVSTLMPPVCSNESNWQHFSTDLSAFAGHNVTLFLVNHDDDYPGDPTYTLFDAVQVNSAGE